MKNGEYELIVAPEDYPGKKYRGKYAYEHRVVYWRTHGIVPEVVHHKNEVKRDNSPSNLEATNPSEHTSEHLKKRATPSTVVSCAWCGAQFEADRRRLWGRSKVYCSKQHQHESMRKVNGT